jgi:hypothetical protein
VLYIYVNPLTDDQWMSFLIVPPLHGSRSPPFQVPVIDVDLLSHGPVAVPTRLMSTPVRCTFDSQTGFTCNFPVTEDPLKIRVKVAGLSSYSVYPWYGRV